MNIFICDDDSVIQKQIRDLLIQYFKGNSYPSPELYTFDSGDELLLSDIVPDIVFLDIEMPGQSGIVVGQKLHDRYKNVIVVIITAYSEYLDDAMRAHAFRFLSKPVNRHRFYRNLDDIIGQINSNVGTVTVDDGDITYCISTDDIVMIETLSGEHKTVIYTQECSYESIDSMQHWCDILKNNASYYQCNRSYIINLKYVTSYGRDSVQLCDNKYEAYITKRKFRDFKSRYLMYIEHIE